MPAAPPPGAGRWALGAGRVRVRARREAGPGLRSRCVCPAAAAAAGSPAFPGRRGLPGPLTRRLVGLPLRAGVFGVVPHLRNKIPVSGLQGEG